MTPECLALLEAHALNTIQAMPGAIDARDKLDLIGEIKRLSNERDGLRAALDDISRGGPTVDAVLREEWEIVAEWMRQTAETALGAAPVATTAPPSIDADMAMRLQRAKAALDAMAVPVTEAEAETAYRLYLRHTALCHEAIRAVLVDFLTTRIAERGSVPPADEQSKVERLRGAVRRVPRLRDRQCRGMDARGIAPQPDMGARSRSHRTTAMTDVKLAPNMMLLLKLSASSSGMYPGTQWELASKKFGQLKRMGLVEVYTPHNPVHKERAVVTEAGRRLLADQGPQP